MEHNITAAMSYLQELLIRIYHCEWRPVALLNVISKMMEVTDNSHIKRPVDMLNAIPKMI